jgi:plastocyanin
MKKLLLFLFCIPFLGIAQNSHIINTVGSTFFPSSLTIAVGDTVTWNNTGGYHNINATQDTFPSNPEGFGNSVSSSAWSFQWIFTLAGAYDYQCDPHAPGMSGVIIANTTGCTDSTALNYDPLATIDDSSCVYCTQNQLSVIVGGGTADNDIGWSLVEFGGSWASASGSAGNNIACIADDCYLFNMYDAGGDGWNGATYTITDSLGNVLSTGTLASGNFGYDILQVGVSVSCPLPPAENLFFSEYAEGSSDNKYFEIFNPTSDTVDLTNYAFARVSNAPTNIGIYEYWNDFDSGAVILPFDVYIVADQDADSMILAQADMAFGSLSNGDDGFALVYGINPGSPMSPSAGGYEILDWIGDWNGDPGQGWDVAGVGAATRNHTLVRKCPIYQGDTSWTNAAGTDPVNSQWIVLSQNDWTNIGVHNACVCDSSTNSYTLITDTICNGLSIVVGNSTYDSTGVYSDTLLAFNGCDSIITTNLTVLSTSASNVINDVTICDGDSVVVGSNVYYIAGTYTDILVNSAGCDSIITTNLAVQTPTYQDITICDGDSIVVGSSVYNSTGSYIDTIQSSIGCDSIVHTNLTLYSQFNLFGGIEDNTVGGGGFYSGSQYLELSAYQNSELVSAVVYSTDTTLTTFQIRDDNGNVLDSVTANIIPGGHRIYFNYLMLAGSDYELGINGSSNNLFRNNSGVSYPYNFASVASVTSSSAGGQYYYYFYDIEIKVLSIAGLTTNYSICDGESITVAGNVYNTTGLYTDSLTSSIGCDSLVFTNLVVHPNTPYTNNQTICIGETYLIGGNIYDSTGSYIDSLNTSYGCDSIVTTNLTVLTITGAAGVNPQTICLGDSSSVGTSTYYTAGVYSDTLTSSNGCDSVVTTTLTVLTANHSTYNFGLLDTLAASGEFSDYDGHLILDAIIPSIIKSANVYSDDTNSVTFELRDNSGIVLDDVTHMVYPGIQNLIFDFVLPAGIDFQLGVDASSGNIGLYRSNASIPYPFDGAGVSITESNAGYQYYYYYYDIKIMPLATYNEHSICESDSIVVGANVYDTTGNYTDYFVASNSCDSMVYTVLEVYQTPSLTIGSVPNPPEICLGDSIILEGADGFDSYWWTDINGNIILIDQRLVDSPTTDIWYLLSAKDSNDCVVKEDIWVFVDSCVTGINDLSLEKEIQLYPNPASEQLTIDFTGNATSIQVYNMLGELVIEKHIAEGKSSVQLFVKEWKGAMYSIQLYRENGTITHKVFTVVR